MKIGVQLEGLKELQQSLQGFSDRRMNAAIATALTRTASEVAKSERAAMADVFDRPTAWTLGSVGIAAANANNLTAEVFIKGESSGGGRSAANYLRWQIGGGMRTMKAFERLLEAGRYVPPGYRVVPAAGARIDAFGNLDRGQLRQILAGLRESVAAGPRQKSFVGQRVRAARKAGGQFFVMPLGKRAAPGIYQRAFGEGRSMTPVLLFVRSANYARRFDFYGIAQRVAEQRLGQEVERAVGDQIARLQATQGDGP